MLDALAPPILSSGSKLQALTELPVTGQDAVSTKRRKVHLRCGAAALLAGNNYQSARLLACDPSSESSTRELAVLQVIGRDKLRGSRKQAYLSRATAAENALREAALGLLAEHGELAEAYRVLADALDGEVARGRGQRSPRAGQLPRARRASARRMLMHGARRTRTRASCKR